MSGVLAVRFGARTVGDLRADAEGRLSFSYASAWLDDRDAFPVSLSLPLRAEPYTGGAGHWFFANLLPEGAVREAVCDRLGISADNDFALLRAIGGECAGALSVVSPDRPPPDPERYHYEEIGDARLQELVEGERVVPLLIGGPTTRLSLAGAQHKVPVALIDGRIKLPLELAPSTHILKLPTPRFAHLAANEAFVLGLAGGIGLSVVKAELIHRTDPPCLLIERYDRRRSDDEWPATRLHQEDLCQALGLPPARKYEQEGGPTLAQVIDLARSNVTQPVVDVRRLLEWQAFNLVSGNSDGHGKNLSILYEPGEGIRVAPFYDLLSTRQYHSLHRSLAMSIGGRREPDEVGRSQWVKLSAELGIGERVVLGIVRDVAERCIDTVVSWTATFREQHGDQPILQTLPAAIAKRGRRTIAAATEARKPQTRKRRR